ncbi:ALP1-like protein isoform X1 [Tanacetum coccineum]
MSDSSNYSNMSDLDDIKDIDPVMQLINEDQQVGESSRRIRKAINRECDVAEARLMADYFGPSPKYPDYYFRRRYRMNRSLFLEIVQDEYLQMREHCARDCLDFFTMCIIDLFTAKVLRKPDANDIRTLYAAHNSVHGLPGMLGSIGCMHWEWINCPKSWHGQFGRGANNDLTVLNHSLLFEDLLDDIASVVPYEVNGVMFEKGYYLADGIYPQWAAFVKSFKVARDNRNVVFKRRQESARKDVERAFGVLQGRWHIIAKSARAWTVNKLRRIMLVLSLLLPLVETRFSALASVLRMGQWFSFFGLPGFVNVFLLESLRWLGGFIGEFSASRSTFDVNVPS